MQPTFLQQRLYPTLQLGLKPTVSHGKLNISLHCRQSDFDGACGLHCAAMALALLGQITHAPSLPKRRRGVAARLWQAAQETYFDGIDEVDLAKMLEALNGNLQVDHFAGPHKKTLEFTKMHIDGGGLVILGYRTKDNKVHHWTLVIGDEGQKNGRNFNVSTLLTLDPSLEEPKMCAYNGRFHLISRPVPQSSWFIEYITNDARKETITFTSAVSIKRTL